MAMAIVIAIAGCSQVQHTIVDETVHKIVANQASLLPRRFQDEAVQRGADTKLDLIDQAIHQRLNHQN